MLDKEKAVRAQRTHGQKRAAGRGYPRPTLSAHQHPTGKTDDHRCIVQGRRPGFTWRASLGWSVVPVPGGIERNAYRTDVQMGSSILVQRPPGGSSGALFDSSWGRPFLHQHVMHRLDRLGHHRPTISWVAVACSWCETRALAKPSSSRAVCGATRCATRPGNGA